MENHVPLRERLMGILLYYDATMIEFGLAVIAVLWGGWLILVPEAFNLPSGTFRVFAQLADESVWGVGIFLTGCLQLAVSLSGHPFYRRMLSLVGFFIWSTVTGLYWLGSSVSLGVPTFAAVSILSIIAFLHNGGTRV